MKKQAKRTVKHGSKHPVRRFDTSLKPKRGRRPKRFIGNSAKDVLPYPLPTRAWKILSILGARGVAGEAAVGAKVVKSTVSYWINRFIHAGALILDEEEIPNSTKPLGSPKQYKPGAPRYYLLTDYGSKLITRGDGVLNFPILFEDRPLIFKVLEREKLSIPWKPLGDVRFWRKKGVMLAGVTVELHDGLGPLKNEATVMIHPGQVKGFNADELLADSAAIVERVKGLLEGTYGIVLEGKGRLPIDRKTHEPIKPRFCVYHPDCKAWMASASVDIPGFAGADASPHPSKHGIRDPLNKEDHFEYVEGKDAALLASMPPSVAHDPAKQGLVDALTAPVIWRETFRLVSSLVCKVEALSVEVNTVKAGQVQVSGVLVELHRLAEGFSKLEKLPEIAESLQKVTGILGQLVALNDGPDKVKVSQESGAGGKDYVS